MSRVRVSRLFGVGVTALLLMASACGDDGEPGETTAAPTTDAGTSEAPTSEAPTSEGPTGGQSILAITQTDFAFEPPKVEVPAGSTVTIENAAGRTPHTFTIEEAGIDVVNEGGQAQNVTLDLEPGTYDFVCTFHDGMAGTLTIS